MSSAIIGFGSIGQALAKAFARKGIDVAVATTREPASFAAAASAIGANVKPHTLQDAVEGAEYVFLAVNYKAHAAVASSRSSWRGKTIIDMTNAYGVPADELGGLPASKVVEQAFKGARLVKGFNHLPTRVLEQDPAVKGGKRVVFLASDDDEAAKEVAALADRLGFAPVQLGGLAQGGLLVQGVGSTWGRLIFQDVHKFDK